MFGRKASDLNRAHREAVRCRYLWRLARGVRHVVRTAGTGGEPDADGDERQGDQHRSTYDQAASPLPLLCLLEEEVGIGWTWAIALGRRPLDNSHDATIIGVMASVKATRGSDSDALVLTEVDRSDPMPLHDQVAAEIRRDIAEGEAGPGDRIPQAKDLAAVLGVNTNTVLRALRVLRDEGLLELGRGLSHRRRRYARAQRRRCPHEGVPRFRTVTGLPT